MSDYLTFLASKTPIVPSSGIDIPDSAINASLFPFQRDLVRWSLRKGRAAIFATTGIHGKIRGTARVLPTPRAAPDHPSCRDQEVATRNYETQERANQTRLCRVRSGVRTATVSAWTEPRSILLAVVQERSSTTRLRAALRVVRHAVLSVCRRARYRDEDQSILLSPVLRRLASDAEKPGHLSQSRNDTRPSCDRGTVAWSAAHAVRSCASHRPRQAQLRSIEPCRLSGSSNAPALPQWGYVR